MVLRLALVRSPLDTSCPTARSVAWASGKRRWSRRYCSAGDSSAGEAVLRRERTRSKREGVSARRRGSLAGMVNDWWGDLVGRVWDDLAGILNDWRDDLVGRVWDDLAGILNDWRDDLAGLFTKRRDGLEGVSDGCNVLAGVSSAQVVSERERRCDLAGNFKEEDKHGMECSTKRSITPSASLTRSGSLPRGRNDIHGEI